jgi:uncharacterized protein
MTDPVSPRRRRGALSTPALLYTLAATWLSACAAPNALEKSKTSEPIVIGDSHVLQSEILGEARQINVWYPQGYAEEPRPLTTVYLVDGALDQDFQHIAGLGHLGALSWTFEPLLIVGIQTKTRITELTSAPTDERYVAEFPEAGESARFRAFIEQEVIPFIEESYTVGPRKALVGESLAGLFVAETFLTAPDLFDDYVAVSPSLWWDDRAMVRRAPELLQAQDPGPRHLYLTMADEGGTMRDGLDMLLAALRSDAPAELEWTFTDRSTTHSHSTILHPAVLEAFRWLYASPPYDYGDAPWYLTEGASPAPVQAGS